MHVSLDRVHLLVRPHPFDFRLHSGFQSCEMILTFEQQKFIRRWYMAKQQGHDMPVPDTEEYEAVRERIAVIERASLLAS